VTVDAGVGGARRYFHFVAHLPTDKATRSIVSAMIDLSHVLGLSVTAEGVETADQFALVASLGADDAQGFYFSKPLAAPQLTDYANNVAGRRRLGLVP
jgi:EAL domain-containing protein (putative c-di-GMP-specific phosphodiesterase class I)